MASEKAVVEQTIDGTVVRIEYSRPSLRGRDVRTDLFGDQIPWGLVWTPGANNATTFETNKDVVLAGATVPAGRYSVWMVVGEEEWELVLDPKAERYHIEHPEPADDQIRAPIETHLSSSVVQTLSWSFPSVRRDGADVRMQWGDLAVDMELEVEPTVRVTLTEEEAEAYAGTWHVELYETEWRPAFDYELELVVEKGVLQGVLSITPDFSNLFGLVVAADQVFYLAAIQDGEVVEVFPGETGFWEFVLDDAGMAVSFEERDPEDNVSARGSRIR